jgi:Icc-related predicted phosphoesterase
VSDLHGNQEKYERLFRSIREELPVAVFIGGDLLPSAISTISTLDFGHQDFVNGFLAKRFRFLRDSLRDRYPSVFIILGNDDGRYEEISFLDVSAEGLWQYVNQRSVQMESFCVYGYSFVPPTPFRLKDWEKFDVSRYVDPGCVAPGEGMRTVPVSSYEMSYGTIREDLDLLTEGQDMDRAVFLFHSPPYGTLLDRAALDGKMVDYAPVDVHIGSIAIERFIRDRQPLLTLHGHVHESARITGEWRDTIGNTQMFNAAHDGAELSLIRFAPESPEEASRELVI